VAFYYGVGLTMIDVRHSKWVW